MIDLNWPVVVRATVNDAMTDSDRVNALLVPQPGTGNVHRGRNIRHRLDRIGAIRKRIAGGATRAQTRAAADPIHLPFQLSPQYSFALDRVDLELDAGGAGIDYKDGVHRVHAAMVGARRRRAWAYSAATAHEAIRARAESAREVRTTGTRAPSTMPAPSALAK